ncbi:NAD-dependent epimerase/dehydratase family protein [Candidatus Microgenomates bacterium]|nr:NAD-dependent epimerase/dehydratase family protein [Candidatus Microgenomates bacterium]
MTSNSPKINKLPFLVTGGCGFVGRHLINKLIPQGSDIWIIDNLFTGKHPDIWLDKKFKKQTNKDKIICYQSDEQRIFFVNDDVINALTEDIKFNNLLPDFSDVFHLASIVGGRAIIDGDPILVAKDLAIDSLFFLWATRRVKRIKRILYASSSAAYPIHIQNNKKHIALQEAMINFSEKFGLPDMTYGWSKLTGEYLSRLAAGRYGLSIACVRPFSGYGEDQDLSYPIPAIARRVALRENPLTVWGTGKQGRDFIHIDDCIDAFFIIMDKIHDGSGCNIGSGKILSFLEVLEVFSSLEGYKPEIKPLVDKPVGVTHRYSDIQLISKLGWKPKISCDEGFGKVLIAAKNRLLHDLVSYVASNGKSDINNFDFSGIDKSEFLNNDSLDQLKDSLKII